jgi:hypothetical protein
VKVDMQPSQVNTITVPIAGTNNPATLAVATNYPMRVVVRNVGPNTIFVAHTSLEIQSVGATAGVFRMVAGSEEVFVLAPRQGIYAVASGVGGLVSIAVSQAIPNMWES